MEPPNTTPILIEPPTNTTLTHTTATTSATTIVTMHNQAAPVEVKLAPAPFSEATFLLLEVLLRFYANGSIALLGVFTNLIVLFVFYRQGIFSNSSTVSLTALAIIDLTCSVLNVWGAVCTGILFYDKSYFLYPFWVRDFWLFTSARPMDMLTQITCWVTAYAAFERLISVVLPFKVKVIFTPTRSLIVNVCLAVFIFLLYCPAMFSYVPRWNSVFRYGRNLTHIKYFRIQSALLRDFSYYLLRINTIGLKASAILVVVACNVTIYGKINLSQKFRQESSSAATATTTKTVSKHSETQESEKHGQQQNQDKQKNAKPDSDAAPSSSATEKKENKEKKLLKMITAISIVFVTCYTPFIIFSILVTLVWEWLTDYHPFTEYLLWNLVTLFQTVNSSTNFFIYFVMSTRFRQEFLGCFTSGKSV